MELLFCRRDLPVICVLLILCSKSVGRKYRINSQDRKSKSSPYREEIAPGGEGLKSYKTGAEGTALLLFFHAEEEFIQVLVPAGKHQGHGDLGVVSRVFIFGFSDVVIDVHLPIDHVGGDFDNV